MRAGRAGLWAHRLSRGILPTVLATILGWLLALDRDRLDRGLVSGMRTGVRWAWQIHTAACLPHELGGTACRCMLAPPAVLFALAAWTVRDQQMSYDMSRCWSSRSGAWQIRTVLRR